MSKQITKGKEKKANTLEEISTYLEYSPLPGELFTLIVYNKDVDAPYMHSIIVNIPGENVGEGDILLSNEYLHKGEPHYRYVVEVYKQSLPITVNERLGDTNRSRFPLNEFIIKTHLHELVAKQTISNAFGLGLLLLFGGLAIGGIAGYQLGRSRKRNSDY